MTRHSSSSIAPAFLILLCAALSVQAQPHTPQRPFTPSASGAYRTGIYPDLFATLLQKERTEVATKLNAAFMQLFHGDSASERLYYPVPGQMAYIEDILHGDVRTEGMSYGMMIAVQMDKKEEFDRIWKWAKTYMQHHDGPHKNYFAWHCRPDGSKLDVNAASDGEEWFVTALLFASSRWGNGDGIYDYADEARIILHTMLHKEDDPGRDTVTNMFNRLHKQVVFVPSASASGFTDPSYHLPHFYELWARHTGEDSSFWLDAAAASRAFLKKALNKKTGLAPDYARFDGTPYSPWGPGAENFRYDAWRVGMNVAIDYLWFARDRWAVEQSNRLLEFFWKQGVGRYGTLFTLDGRVLARDRSTGLVAMNAAACLASTNGHSKAFIEELWNTPVPKGPGRYYDGLLYMLAMLQVGGEFRIYDSTAAPSRVSPPPSHNQDSSYISFTGGRVAIAADDGAADILVSSSDDKGVLRAASDLQSDLKRVTGREPRIFQDSLPSPAGHVIVIGTLGKSPVIDALVRQGSLDTSGLANRWEAFALQTVDAPMKGTARALAITGSDKRGTIFGIYDLSSKIGVSPWYWWADVPSARHDRIFFTPSRVLASPPKVRYRGIFINDEAPALSGWVAEKFGSFNHVFYEHVYELILRMKGNYLWPAMWGRSLFSDDTLSQGIADDYGIVIGTSHHEPMVRAHVEWAREGKGPWNYEKNDSTLRAFWRRGIERMNAHETIVTIGMRGDGDEPMTEGANIALLERIVNDQRNIIHDVTKKDPARVPQLWALYKEVQEYYDKGMRVPDDVTLLLCDDNWGNIRKLPKLGDTPRAGGYGIYYHFDYVGDPRNYKWINTNQISRVWEQMHLAYEYGARTIWIVNVGDIKPMEFPTEFFLDYAWDPTRITAGDLPAYAKRWAEKQFGKNHAAEIGEILTRYTQYNSRRKPELLSAETYSLVNFNEAGRVVSDYQALAQRAQAINDLLPDHAKDAYFQLVLHPVIASANINDLYVSTGLNRLYAAQGRALTNRYASRVNELFARDSAISRRYNREIAGGKWNHMMDQTHMGYTSWQQPEQDTMPRVDTIALPDTAEMGVAIEGSAQCWPHDTTSALLPEFDPINKQERFIEIFNRGTRAFTCTLKPSVRWVKVSAARLSIGTQKRVHVSIDWARAPKGSHTIPITIDDGRGTSVSVLARVRNTIDPNQIENGCFVENDGAVAIEAEHYTSQVPSKTVSWLRIPELGRTLSGMTPVPVTAAPAGLAFGSDAPRLEYRIHLFTSDMPVNVRAYLSPTLNFMNTKTGLRFAVSIDDAEPQIISMHNPTTGPSWTEMVSNNISVLVSRHMLKGGSGTHTVKFWMVDPGVVLQKIVVDTGSLRPSYLGPPESIHWRK